MGNISTNLGQVMSKKKRGGTKKKHENTHTHTPHTPPHTHTHTVLEEFVIRFC